jgi:hypothetical protein
VLKCKYTDPAEMIQQRTFSEFQLAAKPPNRLICDTHHVTLPGIPGRLLAAGHMYADLPPSEGQRQGRSHSRSGYP